MKLPYIKFFVRDWLGCRELRLCSWAARGLWIDMLCLMQDSQTPGKLTHMGKAISEDDLCGLTMGDKATLKGLIAELERHGVFVRDSDGTICCRRMMRDEQRRAAAADAGRKGGNPILLSSEKTEDIVHKTEDIVGHIRLTPPLKGSLNPLELRFTEDQCVSAAGNLAIRPETARAFFRHYAPIDFIDGAGRPIKSLPHALQKWATQSDERKATGKSTGEPIVMVYGTGGSKGDRNG